MRVLLISGHFAKYVLTVCEGVRSHIDAKVLLSHRNYINEIGSGISRPQYLTLIDMVGIRKSIFFLKSLWLIHKEWREYKPDIVHVQEAYSEAVNFWLIFLYRGRYVLTVHDVATHPGADTSSIGWRSKLIKRFVRKKASAIIVHGEKLKLLYKKEFHENEKYQVVKSICHPVFTPSCNREEWVDELSSSILFFGRMEEYKGLSVLLDALNILRNKKVQFKLVIAGRGEDLDKRKSEINQFNDIEIDERFIPPGDVEKYFQRCSIVVTPYIEGSQSGVLAYAIGYRKPLISSDAGSLPEVAIDGFNAIVFPKGCSDLLANAIESVLSDKTLRDALSENSGRLAVSALSAEEVGKETVALYRSVLGR